VRQNRQRTAPLTKSASSQARAVWPEAIVRAVRIGRVRSSYFAVRLDEAIERVVVGDRLRHALDDHDVVAALEVHDQVRPCGETPLLARLPARAEASAPPNHSPHTGATCGRPSVFAEAIQ
jgi:hypothetical protein